MKANDQRIIIFIFPILFLSSCIGNSGKDYQYIETCMQTNLLTTAPKELKPLLIRAKSDSEAYIKAYSNFCISKKFYNREFQKSGAKSGKPLSFKLLNEDSMDIRSVLFLNKEKLEKKIENSVASFEIQKE